MPIFLAMNNGTGARKITSMVERPSAPVPLGFPIFSLDLGGW